MVNKHMKSSSDSRLTKMNIRAMRCHFHNFVGKIMVTTNDQTRGWRESQSGTVNGDVSWCSLLGQLFDRFTSIFKAYPL